MTATLAPGLVALACVLTLPVLTAMGERRRGGSWPVVVLAGAAFPVTWAVWYVLDRPWPREPARPH